MRGHVVGEGEGEGVWWAKVKARVCGGRRRRRGCVVGEGMVGKGKGEGVWWAKARACGGQRRGHVVGRRTREGERGTNEGAKSVDGRSETENINIEHVDVELLHVTLRLSASHNVSTYNF
jgi:hypothetical protein